MKTDLIPRPIIQDISCLLERLRTGLMKRI